MTPPSEPVGEIVHYTNGRIKHEGWYLDGDLHGTWKWYRTDGTLMRSGEFHRGRQVGVWRTFDRTGRLVKQTTFDGGASGQ